MSSVYRINTRTREITREPLKEAWKLLGGRGLIAAVMTEEVNAMCDPLGRENKLILCTSLLAGTNMPMGHRLSVGGKSPLTRTIKEANVGGTAATMLANHDIKIITIEDFPEDGKWFIVKINQDSSAELIPADDFVGLNNYALVDKCKARFGNDIGVMSIGVAGERGYKNSTIQLLDAATGYPSRAAARGGVGSIMGSKKIKAVVIEKAKIKNQFPYADKHRYDEARKKFIELVLNDPRAKAIKSVGTLLGIMGTGPTAILPVQNFSGKLFNKISELNPEAFLKRMAVGGGRNAESCQLGCIIQCSNRFHDKDGNYLTSGLEYETIALLGSNCNISDYDYIARTDRACDDLGIDTVELGATIAVCMEAGKIPWGDTAAAEKLVQEMYDGTEFGKLMGQGTEVVGKALGVKRIPTVKGQAMAGYDPRNLKGIGVTYATSPMGADHSAGLTISYPGDHKSKEGQVENSADRQIIVAACDSLMCLLGLGAALPFLPELMAGIYGGEWDRSKIMEIGFQTITRELAWNKAAGFTEKDNKLPEFFYTEKSPATGASFDIEPEEYASMFQLN